MIWVISIVRRIYAVKWLLDVKSKLKTWFEICQILKTMKVLAVAVRILYKVLFGKTGTGNCIIFFHP